MQFERYQPDDRRELENENATFVGNRKFVSQILTIPPLTAPNSLPGASDFVRLLEAAGQMITVFNARWEYVYVSPTAAAAVHRKPEDLLGQNVFEIFPAIEDSALFRYPIQAMSEQIALEFEAFSEIVQRWYSSQALPLDDGGLLLISRDITERKLEEERLRLAETALVHANDSIVITEVESDSLLGPTIVYVNPAFTQMTGYIPQEVVGKTPGLLQGPETSPQVRRFMRQKMERWESFRAELINYRKNGSAYWVELNVRPVTNAYGWYTHWVAVQRDITERKQYEAALQRSELQLQQVINSSPNAILTLDLEGHLLTLNNHGLEMLEAPDFADVIYRVWTQYWQPEERSRIENALREAGAGRTIHLQGQGRTHGDGLRWWEMIVAPLQPAGRKIEMLIGVITDITEQRHLEQERERMFQEALVRADHDPLTGLCNHRAFNNRLNDFVNSPANEQPYAILVLDLNNFKFFNDAYGHLCGDEMLVLVADTLRRSVRAGDIVGRMGGDEFAILLPGMPRNDVEKYIERLHVSMDRLSFIPPEGGTNIPMELSIGTASSPEDGQFGVELYRIADERCLRNKMGTPETLVTELYETLRTTVPSFAVLDALVTSVDNKDRYTRRHSEEVVRYSLLIAEEISASEEFRNMLMRAALIHDVGKIGVPDRILRHPGFLTLEDRQLMQRHSQMGAILVKAAGGLDDTLDAVLHHHEAWDGTGYPDQLKGEAIPLSARIMAVADAFSAMTTNRPYRKGMSRPDALNVLKASAGTQWDADCVAAFVRAIQRY